MSDSEETEGFDHTAPYKTLEAYGEDEIVVEKSRFIGRAMPVESEEEAEAYVEEVKKEHYDARHVCYGLRVGRGAQRIDRSNDDGEPPRTGGFPIWQVLEGEELEDSLGVVIRYYGGVKLGMGGLSRAYREAARAAIEQAGIVTRYPETMLEVTIPYSLHGNVEHLVESLEFVRVEDQEFAADVEVTFAVWAKDIEEFRQKLGGLLNRDPEDLE